jgi:large subunit ribosomal protein L9
VPATTAQVHRIEHEKAVAVAKSEKLKKEVREQAEKLTSQEVTIHRTVGEDDKLFGSVTAKEIEGAFKIKGLDVDRRKLQMPEPIKQLGTFEIPLKLSADVTATLKVHVVKK